MSNSQPAWSLFSGFAAPDPRDRAPPPAPKKAKKDVSSPTDITAHPLFWTTAPSAPLADRIRKVKLSEKDETMRMLATAHISAAFLPLYNEYKEDDDVGACYMALDEASEITPLALGAGPFQNLVIKDIGAMTFMFDTDEFWIEKMYNSSDGTIKALKFWLHGKGCYIYPVEVLAPPAAKEKKGRVETIDIGKGGKARFYVEE